MRICIGCDHGGYLLKEKVVKHLKDKGYDIEDFGCYSTESCDYPIYGKKVAKAVSEGEFDRGYSVCS